MKDALDKLYEDIESAPSYSAKIEKYLRNNIVHSQHRRIVKKTFPRRRIISRFPFDIFMADLIEYPKLKFQNNQYVFILILIDCFTRKVWAAPMKRKNAQWTADAFESIFKNFDEFPLHIITDRGLGKILLFFNFNHNKYLEFYNTEVRKVFSNYGINHYTTPTRTKWKASFAERVIRTLKSRIQKYFVKNKTKRWIDIIENVVQDYNHTPHSATGFSPQDVTSENRDEVYKKLYPNLTLKTVCRLSVGDKVRKIIEKDIFEKGYSANWSENIYVISKVKQSDGVCWYYLEDLEGEKIKGIYTGTIFSVPYWYQIRNAYNQTSWYQSDLFRDLVLLSIKSGCKVC